MTRALTGTARDVVLLLGRLVLGLVLLAHGWQKVVTNGPGATIEGFSGMGIPVAPAAAVLTMLVEIVGGLMLVVGAFTAVAGVLAALVMVGAGLFVHADAFFAADGGWELVGVIAAGTLVLAAAGAGRFSVDHLVAARRTPVAV
ncbi:DoxX family protein [Pseudonocardia sp. NPDC049154]|uniref:DoxX family protein n=1 Tax=Pseudonocardia sp. NPDC049154 TaxID=3155501 RepID=UPI0033FAD226